MSEEQIETLVIEVDAKCLHCHLWMAISAYFNGGNPNIDHTLAALAAVTRQMITAMAPEHIEQNIQAFADNLRQPGPGETPAARGHLH